MYDITFPNPLRRGSSPGLLQKQIVYVIVKTFICEVFGLGLDPEAYNYSLRGFSFLWAAVVVFVSLASEPDRRRLPQSIMLSTASSSGFS